MLKHFIISVLGITVLSLGILSCQHDLIIVDQPYNDGTDSTGMSENTCDPDSVYFAKDVLPILATSCALSGCYDAQSHEHGVGLIDYSRTIATGQVRAYNPSNSKLYRSLLENGEDQMPPPPRAPLTADQVSIIKKWIEQGAKNLNCKPDAAGCETANVKFSTFIQPLIANRCQGCHNSASTGGNIFLRNYAEIKATTLNGSLYGSVSHAAGYSAMPKVGTRLSSCELAKIQA